MQTVPHCSRQWPGPEFPASAPALATEVQKADRCTQLPAFHFHYANRGPAHTTCSQRLKVGPAPGKPPKRSPAGSGKAPSSVGLQHSDLLQTCCSSRKVPLTWGGHTQPPLCRQKTSGESLAASPGTAGKGFSLKPQKAAIILSWTPIQRSLDHSQVHRNSQKQRGKADRLQQRELRVCVLTGELKR